MITSEYVAHFLGADLSDKDEEKLINGMIGNAYSQIKIATNQDMRENEEYSDIVDDIVCSICYLSYYGNRDDAKNTTHLQEYIDRNIAALQMLV